MPYEGGYMDQPSSIIEKIGLIERLENLRMAEEQEKAQSKR